MNTERDQNIPNTLPELRDTIDNIDHELLAILSLRFTMTMQVGVVKARERLPATDLTREQQKFADLALRAHFLGLPEGLTDRLWRTIIDEVVLSHQEAQAAIVNKTDET